MSDSKDNGRKSHEESVLSGHILYTCAERIGRIIRKKEKAGLHEIAWHVWES